MTTAITKRTRMALFCAFMVVVALSRLVHAQPATVTEPARAPPAGSTEAPRPIAPSDNAGAVGTMLGMPVLSNAGLHELSPWSMFLAADVVVKGVMIGLLVASLITWSVLMGKTIELSLARRRLKRGIHDVQGARTVAEALVALRHDDFLAELLTAAKHEIELSGSHAPHDGIKERSGSRLAELVRVEAQNLRRGMGLLATIGSTAPFVGLFGTVWGIMNSFIGISKSQTTNLAVVAPGIAEALLATAVGLVAAIPAVIIYNHFSRSTRSHQMLITRASGIVGRLVSRELDLDARNLARAAE